MAGPMTAQTAPERPEMLGAVAAVVVAESAERLAACLSAVGRQVYGPTQVFVVGGDDRVRARGRRARGPVAAAPAGGAAGAGPGDGVHLAAARRGPAPARRPVGPGARRCPGGRRGGRVEGARRRRPLRAGLGGLRHRRLRRPLQRPAGRGARPAAVRRDPRRRRGLGGVDAGAPRPVPRPGGPRLLHGPHVGGGGLLPAGPPARGAGGGGALVRGPLRGPGGPRRLAGARRRDPGHAEGLQPDDPGLGGPAGLPLRPGGEPRRALPGAVPPVRLPGRLAVEPALPALHRGAALVGPPRPGGGRRGAVPLPDRRLGPAAGRLRPGPGAPAGPLPRRGALRVQRRPRGRAGAAAPPGGGGGAGGDRLRPAGHPRHLDRRPAHRRLLAAPARVGERHPGGLRRGLEPGGPGLARGAAARGGRDRRGADRPVRARRAGRGPAHRGRLPVRGHRDRPAAAGVGDRPGGRVPGRHACSWPARPRWRWPGAGRGRR